MSPSAARSPRPETSQDQTGQDAARQDAAPNSEPRRAACFSVVARAEPGVLPRVMELFAKRGLVPSSWHSTSGGTSEGGGELTIDIQMRGMAVETADFIAARLRQIPDVELVLTSQKR
jgi:acetolactate synthase small subunit